MKIDLCSQYDRSACHMLNRLSAGHLRFHQTQLVSRLDFPGVIQDNQSAGPIRRRRRWRPAYVNHNHLRELIDALEGFVLVTNMHGKIIYVSPTVEGFLGHQHVSQLEDVPIVRTFLRFRRRMDNT